MNWKRPLRDTLIMLGGVVAVMFVASWALNGLGNPNDIQNYYEVNLGHPYHEPYLGTSSFVYSPPAALLVSWLHLLPFPFVATAQRLLQSAALIGRVADKSSPLVTLKSAIGASRILDMPSGEQLPRIC